jgi:hypothetical protein
LCWKPATVLQCEQNLKAVTSMTSHLLVWLFAEEAAEAEVEQGAGLKSAAGAVNRPLWSWDKTIAEAERSGKTCLSRLPDLDGQLFRCLVALFCSFCDLTGCKYALILDAFGNLLFWLFVTRRTLAGYPIVVLPWLG